MAQLMKTITFYCKVSLRRFYLERGVEMLEKMKEHFQEVELTCSKCGKTLKEGERFSVTLIMPSEKLMPVGPLDKVLAKRAIHISCGEC